MDNPTPAAQPEMQYVYNADDGLWNPQTITPETAPTPAAVDDIPVDTPAVDVPPTVDTLIPDPTPIATDTDPVPVDPDNPSPDSEAPTDVPSDLTTPQDPAPVAEPVDPVVDDNFYRVQAEEMITRGELPQDFDLDREDLSGATIMQAWEENHKESYIQRWQAQALQQLKQNGYSETHLETARRLDNGVSQEDIEIVLDYRDLAAVQLDKLSDEEAESYARDYFIDKDSPDFIAEAAIEKAREEGKMNELLETANNHFNTRFSQEDARTKEQANLVQKQKQQLEYQKQMFVSGIFQNKKIGNTELSDNELVNLYDGLTKANVPYQTQKGVVNVTQFQAFENSLANYNTRVAVFNAILNSSTLSDKAIDKMQAKAEQRAARVWGGKSAPKKAPAKQPTKKATTTSAPTEVFKFEGGQFVPA